VNITETIAIQYLTGITQSLKAKIEVADSQTEEEMKKESALYVAQEERMLCKCLEIVISKAKANILFKNG